MIPTFGGSDFAMTAQRLEPEVFHGMPAGAAAWGWAFACGSFKLLLAAASVVLFLLDDKPMVSAVGWLLLAGGAAEVLLGWGSRRSHLGSVTLASGALTLIAGMFFVASGWTGLLPLANVVMIWLLLRGLVSLDVGLHSRNTLAANWEWLVTRGAVDLGLGAMLLMGIHITAVMLLLLGSTREIAAAFGLLLAASFAVAGMGLITIALAQRRWTPQAARGLISSG
jgi:uncharacterized membrane protein HdeD (DUF308 family)